MKGKELIEKLKNYDDFDIEFIFTDGYSHNGFPNERVFNNIEVAYVGHSEKVVVLSGNET